jgi:serpin B
MLMARFQKPKPRPASRLVPKTSLERNYFGYTRSGKPEEVWISGAFLYRSADSLSQDFIDRVKYDFGFAFRAVDERSPQSAVLANNWDSSLPIPDITNTNDFWITTFTHLRTSWAGNTFVGAKREPGEFKLSSGNVIKADFLKSEFAVYEYAHTDEYDAVSLPCNEASILLVLPAPDRSIEQLEEALAKEPVMGESSLARKEGDVQFPPFHFYFGANLRGALEKMGVHRVFSDPHTLLSMAPKKEGGVLRGVAQKAQITVDEKGIRADAGTVAHGVFGGIMMPQNPFHLVLDRPFLFIVRDNATKALLFIGTVMDPTIQ